MLFVADSQTLYNYGDGQFFYIHSINSLNSINSFHVGTENDLVTLKYNLQGQGQKCRIVCPLL